MDVQAQRKSTSFTVFEHRGKEAGCLFVA